MENIKINTVDTVYKKPTKKELYTDERLDLLNRLNLILGISETNNIIYPHLIDENKQKQILELEDDVKKYFKYGNWAYFSKAFDPNRPYISFIRSIYKDMGFKLISTKKTININGTKTVSYVYILSKN